MYKFQEIFDSTLLEILADSENEQDLENLEEKLTDMIPDLTVETAKGMLASIKKDAFSGNLENAREDRRKFEERLSKHWGKPLELLELFIILATEAGADFNSYFRNDAVKSGDAVFEALTRLHARACQVSSAILILLKSGYADDAHARWRSLHEIAVVSSFISQHGQKLAERYLLHELIQQYKLASEHQKFQNRINEDPISQEELDNLKSERDKLIGQYGKSFKEEYGWAADALGSDRPTIRAMEEQVGLDHLRPYYRMASDNVHANSHGANYRLGLHLSREKVLLAGPSNAGLADPGHSTAISLNQITITLLATRVSLDNIVVMNILGNLVPEIGKLFLESHHEYEAITLGKKELEA